MPPPPRRRRKWLCRDWDAAVAIMRDRAPETLADSDVVLAAEHLRRDASDPRT